MRFILTLAFSLLFSFNAFAQAFVQANANQASTGAITATSAVTAGNLLVLCSVVSTTDGTVTGVTSSPANTWALARQMNLSNRHVSLWYAMNTAAGSTTATVAVTGTLDSQHLAIGEYSGLATTGALGAGSTGGPTNSTSPASGNVTTTSANAAVVGCTGLAFAGVTYTATGSNTYRAGTTNRAVLADRIVSATGSYDITGTLAPTEEWGVVAVEFQVGGGGGGGSSPRRLMSLGVGQ